MSLSLYCTVVIGHSENKFAEFLKSQLCIDIIPSSMKLVVFDTRLKVG